MNISEVITAVNSYTVKKMSSNLVNKNITDIEGILKKLILFYIREMESTYKNHSQFSRRKKLPYKLYLEHYHYIACIIGARFEKHGTIGTSQGFVDNYKTFGAVNSKLKLLGNVGARSPKKNKNGRFNIIGKCAEIKAAYQLNSKSKISQLKDIEFTNAYRPRTSQIIERCSTCKFVFGNV
ncbi:hypothetical protein [Flavobacterium subsaxonicum]|uniref:Uncharacterized protein n=1 Tax=Flavobacterium subsaxonicum WB 4.1-42 = DSM 21790 TaxID=1121898 RepID=A0A0A2MIH2_9FLAO|nr:hypothetical protein [Flavobacterium subsaxonicum]KGO91243.1 hypothetical protein Q766_18985 [Flavobacterium subsaxonicum WB 4.1-42 = DSM 21790]